MVGRWWLLLLLPAGCVLDESGLTPLLAPDAAEVEASLFDASTSDVVQNDVVTADAPIDSPNVVDTGIDTGTIDAGVDAEPIIAITGGTYTLDGDDAGICSGNTGSAINFQLFNQRDASVDLIWVNYQCAEVRYATVLPAGNVTQGTYVNHVWRVRNSSDQAFLAEFILKQQQTYSVTMH